MRLIDLSKGIRSDHPDIELGKKYLVKFNGAWYLGLFTRQWYGWSFIDWGTSGKQFDTPGQNSSTWQAIIELDPEELFLSLQKVAPDPEIEAVAWTGSGSLAAVAVGLEGHMWGEKADAHPIPLVLASTLTAMATEVERLRIRNEALESQVKRLITKDADEIH